MDWAATQQRLADLFAEPRADVPAAAMLIVIGAAVVVLLVMAVFALIRRSGKRDQQVIVDADGKRYLVISSTSTPTADARSRKYRALSVAFLVASIASAIAAWVVSGI